MPDRLRAAGLHHVDARVRHRRPGWHVQLAWKGAVFDAEGMGVFLGLDAGETAHRGHGLTSAGKKVLGRRLTHHGRP
jgi:hypothetical protein